MTEPTVFISYAREDYDVAKKLYDNLKAAGAKPWLDQENIIPGQRWQIAIKDAIRSSRFFVALLSRNSTTGRGFVQKEFKQALDALDEFPDEDIFLIPARLDDCDPPKEQLRDIHYVDMFPDWEYGLNRLLQAIGVDSALDSSPPVRVVYRRGPEPELPKEDVAGFNRTSPIVKAMMTPYLTAFFNSSYVVEGGRAAGHQPGDMFAVEGDGEVVKDQSGRVIHRFSKIKAQLSVESVDEYSTICRLKNVDLNVTANPLDCVPKDGDEVYRIPAATWEKFQKVDFENNRRKRAESETDIREAEEALVQACDEFIQDESESILHEQALWLKGIGLLGLGMFDEAIHTFESYRQRFNDVKDASDLIEEAVLRRIIAQGGQDAISAQWELARTFLRKQDFKQAAIEFERAIATGDTNVGTHLDPSDRAMAAFCVSLFGGVGNATRDGERSDMPMWSDDMKETDLPVYRDALENYIANLDTLPEKPRQQILAHLAVLLG